ncbi:MAG: SPASM domain-containing protein, partial [Candidatus Vogelbacteria bacterium]|nr:SPASM domain-containing protein [Candidatus Vogelbacteria bacterium]
ITNAMRFGDDRFWEEYQNSPNTSAGISVKASNAEDLLEVAGIGDFKKMVLGIKRGLQFFQCGVGMTYNTYYTEKLIDLAKFSVDNGAKSIKVDFCSTVFESGTAVNCHMVEPTEIVRKIMRDYDRLTEITGGRLVFEMNMPLCLWPADFIQHLIEHDQILTVCHVLKRQGIIFDTEGKVLMCNGLFDYPIGQFGADFDDAESLTKFLNKPEVSFFYEQISAFPSEKCQTCEVYNLCGGGCPLKWAVYKPHEMISGYHGKTLTVRKEGGEQHECSVA